MKKVVLFVVVFVMASMVVGSSWAFADTSNPSYKKDPSDLNLINDQAHESNNGPMQKKTPDDNVMPEMRNCETGSLEQPQPQKTFWKDTWDFLRYEFSFWRTVQMTRVIEDYSFHIACLVATASRDLVPLDSGDPWGEPRYWD